VQDYTAPESGRLPFPWEDGSATGIGSMPGTDPAEAMRVIAGELPGFPYLPELPDRGPGADLTGRTAALLVGAVAAGTVMLRREDRAHALGGRASSRLSMYARRLHGLGR